MCTKINITIKKCILFIAVIIGCITSAQGMSVEPMVLDMVVAGQDARRSFKVTNSGTKPLPVEVNILALELSQNGEQSTARSDDKFLVYPAQAMIAAGGSQVFRVQWIGDADLGESRSYLFNVSQVPVQLPKGTSGIQIVMSFGLTVNVAPIDGRPNINVLGAEPVTSKGGKRLAKLRLSNSGNKHAYLKQSSVRLSGAGWSAEMTPGEIAQKVGLGIVQPGKERHFVLPLEVPSSVSKLQATVELQPER